MMGGNGSGGNFGNMGGGGNRGMNQGMGGMNQGGAGMNQPWNNQLGNQHQGHHMRQQPPQQVCVKHYKWLLH